LSLRTAERKCWSYMFRSSACTTIIITALYGSIQKYKEPKVAVEYNKLKRKFFLQSYLGLLYSLQALANASAYWLTALLAGTFSESSPSNFPWRESMYLKNNHKLDIKKQLGRKQILELKAILYLWSSVTRLPKPANEDEIVLSSICKSDLVWSSSI
jgi:hypothetical protein